VYVEEPDNHFRSPFAFRVKRGLGRGEYPALAPDEEAAAYEQLWRVALEPAAEPGRGDVVRTTRRRAAARLLSSANPGDVSAAIARPGGTSASLRVAAALAVPDAPRPSSRARIVKTVHAACSLEWIAARFDVRPLIVWREPLNVISSWRELGWFHQRGKDLLDELDPGARADFVARTGIAALARGASDVARAAWLLGYLTRSLLDASGRNPTWATVSHEALCREPHRSFRSVYAHLGLDWSPSVDAFLDEMNRPGEGYEITRVGEELPEVWRSRLAQAELEEIASVLEEFALDADLADVLRGTVG
jgi:hypothetical protein